MTHPPIQSAIAINSLGGEIGSPIIEITAVTFSTDFAFGGDNLRIDTCHISIDSNTRAGRIDQCTLTARVNSERKGAKIR